MKTFKRVLPDLSPEALADLARLPMETAALRTAQLAVGRTLAALETLAPERFGGSAGMGELGERHGLAADEARTLVGLGRAVLGEPAIAPRVCVGKIPVASAALLGEVLPDSGLQRPGDTWLVWAETETTKQLRLRVWERQEEARRDRRPVVLLSVYVSHQGRRDFDRACTLASRKAQLRLSPGLALERMVDHYLDRFDPARVTPGRRRMPDTRLVMAHGAGALKGQFRHVPAEVCRAIFARQGERCAVRYCERSIFLDKAHVVEHSHDGDREVDNLLVLCSYHHGLLDSGKMRMEGTAASPRFFDEEGRDLSQRVETPVAEATEPGQLAREGSGAETRRAPARVEEVPGYVVMNGGFKRVEPDGGMAGGEPRTAHPAGGHGDTGSGGCWPRHSRPDARTGQDAKAGQGVRTDQGRGDVASGRDPP